MTILYTIGLLNRQQVAENALYAKYGQFDERRAVVVINSLIDDVGLLVCFLQ